MYENGAAPGVPDSQKEITGAICSFFWPNKEPEEQSLLDLYEVAPANRKLLLQATLVGLKRIMERVEDGGLLSIVWPATPNCTTT